jgi:hypothetical protein
MRSACRRIHYSHAPKEVLAEHRKLKNELRRIAAERDRLRARLYAPILDHQMLKRPVRSPQCTENQEQRN